MLLDKRLFFVRERVAVMKLTDTYDIIDPQTQQPMGFAKEEISGALKGLRLFMNKTTLPTTVNVYEAEGMPPVFSIHRPLKMIRAKVDVTDRSGQKLGYLKSKLLTIGGGFNVYDTNDKQIAEVKGDWVGWNFQFISENGQVLGTITKKWGGVGRELFTSADNYIIELGEGVGKQQNITTLLLAAGLAVDIVYKEGR